MCFSIISACIYKSIGAYEFEGEILSTSNVTTIDACVDGCTESSCTAFAWNPFDNFFCIKTSEPTSNKIVSGLYTALVKTDCTGKGPGFEPHADHF